MEFKSENRFPWQSILSQLAPALAVIVAGLGVGFTRWKAEGIQLFIAVALVGIVLGFYLVRWVMHRRQMHIKITSDWIRITYRKKKLSAPLHYVLIEPSPILEGRYKVRHPRKKLAFTVSLTQFPENQREALAALLQAHASRAGAPGSTTHQSSTEKP